jgi:uncharacterized protein YjdB
MKKVLRCVFYISFLLVYSNLFAQNNAYIQRFIDLRAKIVDPSVGYFSPEGAPYHSIETLMVEAPDHGHQSTSEAYSFWIWLEAMHGRVSGDWSALNSAWTTLAKQIIPADSLQPTSSNYVLNGGKATYAAEYPLPSMYPSALDNSVPVGTEPVSKELYNTYGTASVYGMHWLLDCDNFYGYGIKNSPNAKPSYINTFQRGEQESTWETVPQPCYDLLKWGGPNGYLDLFVKESGASAKQWKYTNAPDADARAVQAIYWAVEWAKQQGKSASVVPAALASKMGDYLRLSMFDKYYKPIGCQSKSAAGGSGYESCHYLMSWYYAWGGPHETNQNWGWRIGCSHSHFGYQNPLAAYVLSNYSDLIPKSPNAKSDWSKSLQRQLEFYRWLQSSEGGIAGGCTNMWDGNYSAYPSGTPTFYKMAYVEHPVYHDPGSNKWFGMQAWSVERLAEYYYLTNNSLAKEVLDKWVKWVKDPKVVKLYSDGTYEIPSDLKWSGKPDTWDPANPGTNSGLHVEVTSWGKDLGITACLAKALTYYAAATQKYGTLDADARNLAKELLDRMWNNYWEGSSGKGLGVPEEREDYRRFDSIVYIPNGWTGKMPNGDVIQPGVKFIDIRTKYKSDPQYSNLRKAIDSGQKFKITYHRFWAQVDIALANAEYGYFFGDTSSVAVTGVSVTPQTDTIGVNTTLALNAVVSPNNATNKNVTWTSGNTSVATVTSAGVVKGIATGKAIITVTTADGGFKATSTIYVSNSIVPVTGVTLNLAIDSIKANESVTLIAGVLPSNAINKNVSWKSSNTSVATVSSIGVVTGVSAGSATITVTTEDGGYTATCLISVIQNGVSCKFGTPLAVSLPTINGSYTKIHVLGSGGPSLSNVTNFTINWDLSQNGLWQMSFNTNNGVPTWWLDLRTKATWKFKQAQPEITFSGTGISGLDGSYYVAIDGSNFVIVSKTGGFTIYFSNSSIVPVCETALKSGVYNSEEVKSQDKVVITQELSEVVLYPNPFTSSVSLKLDNPQNIKSIEVVDQTGKVVKVLSSDKIDNNQIEFGSDLPKGIYFIRIKDNNNVKSYKIIKN